MRSIIRSLRNGESPPDVTPRRYRSASGYIRLRWRVGPLEQVECYEHRWVMQCFDPEVHVHHINHDKADNRPENLQLMSNAEHGHEHRVIDESEAIRLYATGVSIPEVARQMGHDNAAILRLLVRNGITIRPGWTYHLLDLDSDLVRSLHEAGVRSRRIALALGVSATAVDARVHEMGLSPHRDGRPTNAEIATAHAALAAHGLAA